jgi:putative addiction module component (TIGR02574 family)
MQRAALEVSLWQATPTRDRTKQEHSMATPIEELEAKVLNLPVVDRSRLLDKLLASLDQDQSIEDAWKKEAKRRDDEIESGVVVADSGDAVMARLRAKLK